MEEEMHGLPCNRGSKEREMFVIKHDACSPTTKLPHASNVRHLVNI